MIEPLDISISRFLASWHGPADTPPAPLSKEYEILPESLREWHRTSSRWSTPVMTMKRMRTPKELIEQDGLIIFMDDPGDSVWAYRADAALEVYEGPLHSEWEKVAEDLPEFLIHNMLNEAPYTAVSRASCDDVPERWLPDVLAPMDEVGFGGWRWPRPGHRVFMGDGLVADVGPAMEDTAPWGDKPGHFEVQIGANDPEAMSYLDSIRSVDWFRSGEHRP